LLRRHYSPSLLLRTHPPPSHLSVNFPFWLYDLPFSRDFSGMRKASPVAQKCPCVHAIANTPLGDIFRFNQFSKYICCLHPEQMDSTPRVMSFSKLPMRSLSLRPGYSLTILLMALSIDSNSSVSLSFAIQATEFWLLLWWIILPLNISYLIWTYRLILRHSPEVEN